MLTANASFEPIPEIIDDPLAFLHTLLLKRDVVDKLASTCGRSPVWRKGKLKSALILSTAKVIDFDDLLASYGIPPDLNVSYWISGDNCTERLEYVWDNALLDSIWFRPAGYLRYSEALVDQQASATALEAR